MPDDPGTVLRRHIRNALAQMRREIPPMHQRTAADVQAAEDRCVEALVQVVTNATSALAAPPPRGEHDHNGGQFGLAPLPRTRHMDQLPPRVPSRIAPSFGFGKDVAG